MSNYSEVARRVRECLHGCVRACATSRKPSGVGVAGRHVFAVAVALDSSFIIVGNLEIDRFE